MKVIGENTHTLCVKICVVVFCIIVSFMNIKCKDQINRFCSMCRSNFYNVKIR